jgi:hypothetical protein
MKSKENLLTLQEKIVKPFLSKILSQKLGFVRARFLKSSKGLNPSKALEI